MHDCISEPGSGSSLCLCLVSRQASQPTWFRRRLLQDGSHEAVSGWKKAMREHPP